jgi:malate dehydrogenase (quinone)
MLAVARDDWRLAEYLIGQVLQTPSTSAFIAFQVLQKCFADQLAVGWRDRVKTIIPTYGIDLTQDAAACRDIRAKTASVLGLANI